MGRSFGLFLGLMLPLLPASFAGVEIGEFELPEVIPLSRDALRELRELAKSDPEAAAVAQEIAERARPHLGEPATPLKAIHYEGLVNSDPRRVATVAKLKQTGEAGHLLRSWQATGDAEAAETLQAWTSAWFETYEVTGNDVNENKLFPLLAAYWYLRDGFPSSRRAGLDAFVRRLGERHAEAARRSTRLTNRYTKSARLVAICGMILEREDWLELAYEGVKRFVSESLYGDGSSRDLRRRDTLTYHSSALRPPIQLAMLLGDEGRELYFWENDDGGSLARSVRYVYPYAMGEKRREEWRRSKADLDRRRAEAGLDSYRPGSLYDPRKALELMEQASFFDPGLMRAVRRLSESEAKRFPTWQTLLNAAVRRAD